jgi:ABC-type molybdate transport system ATPase subunit
LVLLDEPFSALDDPLRRDLVNEVRMFVDEACVPLIHVTHHRHEARALADRVLLIERGRIHAAGSAAELML